MGRTPHAPGRLAILATLLVTTVAPANLAPASAQTLNATESSVAAMALNAPIVGMAATPSGQGYWRVATDGGIFTAGDAHFFGSTGAIHLNQPIVGMTASPTGHGYWFVASDGGIFSFGDAHFYGSTGALTLNQPIVGMASTPSGHGYWLIARDGGIFAFGDAHFYGSTGALHLNQPIVGGTATPSGHGYWFVASDGGIFSFGDARYHGSTGNLALPHPIVGMASAPDGLGYLLVGAGGSIYAFGSASSYGSASGACPGGPAVAVATARHARGYWIAFADARTYALSPTSAAPQCGPSGGSQAGAAAMDMFSRLNDERRARGLGALHWNSSLASYATSWSRNMASHGFLHSDIGTLLGPFNYAGENIAEGSRGVSASALHTAWMHSLHHRDNMLAPGFDTVGVGVYCAPDGSMWATTDFGRLASSGPPPAYGGDTQENPIARADTDKLFC